MSDDETFTEGELEAMLVGLLEIRALRDLHARAYEAAKKPIADYLARHGGSILDQESGIRATLQDKRGTPELDTAHLPDGLLRWMADQHALKLDAKVYGALAGKAPEHLKVNDFISPGAGSQSLIISKGE